MSCVNCMRIFIPPENISKHQSIKAPPDKARYLLSVLKSQKGDRLDIIDGKGKAYEVEITEISKKDVFVNIIREIVMNTESSAHLVLCQGILKGEKMDMVIQKATELGVREIVPLITERCLVRETRKVKRWGKIAEEAAEQCGRAVIPDIHEPVELAGLLQKSSLKGLIFWEQGGLPLSEAIHKVDPAKPIDIFVGPEGGLTAEEVQLAEEHGLVRATLGRRTLRAETAALVSVALVQYLVEGNEGC